jgi:hypothetical protein
MKSISYIFVILLALQLSTNCKKEPTLEPDCDSGSPKVSYNHDFELVWHKRSKKGFTCYSTVVTSTNVIYFLDPPDFGSSETILALDKANGDTLWVKNNQGSNRNQTLVGNKLFFKNGNNLRCIETLSGNILWTSIGNSSKSLNDFIYANNKIYAFFDLGGGIFGDSTKLYEINSLNGSSTEKFTLYGSDRNGFNQGPLGMVYYQHPNGNEIIFTQSQSHNLSITTSRGEYYAIDITNDSMYWDLKDYYNLNGIGCNPILKGDNIIINGPWSQHTSINLRTKTINWNTQVPSGKNTSRGVMVELNGKVFQSLGNNYNLNIINTNDGSLLKNYSNTMGFDNWAANMKKYNNAVYLTSTAGLYKLDANGNIDKQILTRELLAEGVGGSYQYLDIDPTNGYIYCTAGNNILCIKEK